MCIHSLTIKFSLIFFFFFLNRRNLEMLRSKRDRKPAVRHDPSPVTSAKKKRRVKKKVSEPVPPKKLKLKITFKGSKTTSEPPRKRKRKIKMSMAKDELLTVCGEREYNVLYKNGTSVVDKGKREIEEKDIPEVFDHVDPADGSLVRTLDAFCLCDMNGIPVSIEDVFDGGEEGDKRVKKKIQAFGTVILPSDCDYDSEDAARGNDAQFQQTQKEKRKKQRRVRVWIPSIVDWCFDYSIGGNSKLWLISESGAWYV